MEDVSADSDPDDLRRVTDVLAARRIRSQIALIPVFKDPSNHVELYLSDRPEVVEALHYMVAHGGTIVMHGVTHQVHGVSGDDYEFWDALANRPAPDGAFAVLKPKPSAALRNASASGCTRCVRDPPLLRVARALPVAGRVFQPLL